VKGHVRVSAKAVVVVEGRVLLLRHRDSDGDWYALPGGGQRHGETLHEAVERECREETGITVRPGRLLFVRDYIAANHEFSGKDRGAHQIELMFECEPAGAEHATLGRAPDEMQTGVDWVELSELGDLRMYPKTVARVLAGGVPDGGPVYLGDVN